ncbi:MAG: tRNA (adenosine(37)-N6)-dimethylallyltransferase MiaA [Rickettsiaceae bacterium]
MRKAVIVCGPTASGKTLFAHEFAKKYGGEIINADSMQIYKQLPIITASPSDELKHELPYHLYNFQDIDKEFSATKYTDIASETISEIDRKECLPVIVGGSGMYINMLIYGYNSMPVIESEIRFKARSLHKDLGAKDFFQKLKEIDPQITQILNVGDTQRVIRAYEVALQTGKSILHFQQQDNTLPLPGFSFEVILLLPERRLLYELCNKRFLQLFEQDGAVEEVKAVYAKYGDLRSSAMKALGVEEIIAYINGKISKQAAIELASTKTRQYAKRQCTWFTNQIKEKKILQFGSGEEYNNLVKNLPMIKATNDSL